MFVDKFVPNDDGLATAPKHYSVHCTVYNHDGRCTNILQSVWLVHSHHGALIYSWSPPGIAMVVEPTDSHFDAADHLDEVEEAFFWCNMQML